MKRIILAIAFFTIGIATSTGLHFAYKARTDYHKRVHDNGDSPIVMDFLVTEGGMVSGSIYQISAGRFSNRSCLYELSLTFGSGSEQERQTVNGKRVRMQECIRDQIDGIQMHGYTEGGFSITQVQFDCLKNIQMPTTKFCSET